MQEYLQVSPSSFSLEEEINVLFGSHHKTKHNIKICDAELKSKKGRFVSTLLQHIKQRAAKRIFVTVYAPLTVSWQEVSYRSEHRCVKPVVYTPEVSIFTAESDIAYLRRRTKKIHKHVRSHRGGWRNF